MTEPTNPTPRNSEQDSWPTGWPPWKLRDSGWFVTVLGGFLALLLFVREPPLLEPLQKRIGLVIFLAAAVLLLALLIYAIECISHAFRKVRAFDRLLQSKDRIQHERDDAQHERDELRREVESTRRDDEQLRRERDEALLERNEARAERDASRAMLRWYVAERTQYALTRVMLHKEQYYIVVRKKSGPPLAPGTHFAVIDLTDGALMGRFTLVRVINSEYEAVADGPIDNLWSGVIRATPGFECAPPPNTAAFVLPAEEQEA
jgi:hypothetical protein